jgi:CRP-like cAMP-binding protein
MYGWIIAVIASTVSNNEAAEVSYRNKLEDTKRYLKVHDVPKALINRVVDVRYIEWERYQGTAVPGEECIGADMGENFRTSLLYETVHDYIIRLPFFKGIDESFITTICTSAHTYHYSEGDIITYTGDLSRNLCIVRSGHCDVVTEDLSTIVEHLKPYDYFGEIEVLFGSGSPRTVVADTCCEIIVLTKDEIDNALKSFPIVAHHFTKIEQDENYKNSIINTMNRRAQTALTSNTKEKDMMKRYNTAKVVDNVSIYSTRVVKDQFCQMLNGIPSFSSESTYYVYYELYRVFAIVLTMATVPLLFSVSQDSNLLWALQYILDALSLLDMIVKGLTGYYNV